MKVSQYELMPAVDDLLKAGKQVSFKVSGNSKWPFLNTKKQPLH